MQFRFDGLRGICPTIWGATPACNLSAFACNLFLAWGGGGINPLTSPRRACKRSLLIIVAPGAEKAAGDNQSGFQSGAKELPGSLRAMLTWC